MLDCAHTPAVLPSCSPSPAPASLAASRPFSPPLQLEYKKQLAANLGQDGSARILAFKQKAPAPAEGFENPMASLYTANNGPKVKKTFRAVPQQPERILDAPDLVDDYYLNLLDWGSTNSVSCIHASGAPAKARHWSGAICCWVHGRAASPVSAGPCQFMAVVQPLALLQSTSLSAV